MYKIAAWALGFSCLIAAQSMAASPEQPIDISSAICVLNPDQNTIWVHAELTNTTNKQLPDIQMSYTFYDSTGDVINTSTGMLEADTPNPGQSVNTHFLLDYDVKHNANTYITVNIEPVNSDGTPIAHETYMNVFCAQIYKETSDD